MQISSNSSYNFDTTVTFSQNNPEDNIAQKNKDTDSTQESQKNKDTKKDSTDKTKLTQEEQQQVNKLQARDTEVRAHEAAHKAAGGGLAGSASFSYQRGPDGKMYAIGGEVPISFQEGSTPQETIANARQVVAAAMAPANPSPQDYSVASSARMMELRAQQELIKEQMEKIQNKDAASTSYTTDTQKNNNKIDIAI
jgi:hypothetical protein